MPQEYQKNGILFTSESPRPKKIDERITATTQELVTYSQSHAIPSLSDRIRRGLDPIGMLALDSTKKSIQDICKKLSVSYEDIEKMTLDIQLTGPWKYADKFKNPQDPATKIWIMLKAIHTTALEKHREQDLTPKEFLTYLAQVKHLLSTAVKDPHAFFPKAYQHAIEDSQKEFRIEDGVPISEKDNGMIAMAVNGHRAGIYQDADGFLHVGADQIDDDTFLKWGLKTEQRDDGRGRIVTFFVNDKGEGIAKKLYPGYVIVLSRNFDLAKAIVQKVETVTSDILGQTLYEPTSITSGAAKKERALKIKKSKRITEIQPASAETKEDEFKNIFYSRLAYVKAQEIFRDRANALIKKMREKQKGRITNDTLESEASKTQNKVEQKMEELHYLTKLMWPFLDSLPKNVTKVMDMAGGAGDFGMAVGVEMTTRGMPPSEMIIVEPFEELKDFNQIITAELPESEWFQKTVRYDQRSLQEVSIQNDTIVVAKHPCGDLTDAIIEQWVRSESPLLVIMTCYQEKAVGVPARYNIDQKDWDSWCKASGKTNAPDIEKRTQGMEAMTHLDEARVAYLRRHGFQAELIQTDAFPKGDVIIARRIQEK